jgi:hypothetical protein
MGRVAHPNGIGRWTLMKVAGAERRLNPQMSVSLAFIGISR